ncbi:MAG: MBOAT family protein [Lachnospiraceae bacterium]|nr:MBOAT family protein [Lachnospiraceae bacterium]
MAFTSAVFLLFITVVCAVYFTVPIKRRWLVLLLASYLFYWQNSTYLVFVLAGMTAVTWLTGLFLERQNLKKAYHLKIHSKHMSSSERKKYKLSVSRKKKGILFLGITIDFGILLVFKYSNFFIGNASSLFQLLGIETENFQLDLMIPLGISFYTLQAIGYMADIYWGKYQADRNFLKFALFMSYFPQIVQGPIARYDKLAVQFKEGHAFDAKRLKYGSQLILWGFMKKLILADRIGIVVDTVFNDYANYGGLILLTSVIFYGFQIYADFSGGMDIATGVSQIFGINLEINFRQPYFSKSIEEFWRRWHITLGGWMKDYIFYPLSLSKKFATLGRIARKYFGNYIGKRLPPFLSMFLVYFLVGFWHGPNWKYAIYGVWNGTIIASGILLQPLYQKGIRFFHVRETSYGWRLFQTLRTFLLCSIGRFFPKSASSAMAFLMIKNVFLRPMPWQLVDGTLFTLGLDAKDLAVAFFMSVILLLVDNAHERNIQIRESIASQGIIFRWLIFWTAFFLIIIFGIYGPAYNSSDFIYQQF